VYKRPGRALTEMTYIRRQTDSAAHTVVRGAQFGCTREVQCKHRPEYRLVAR